MRLYQSQNTKFYSLFTKTVQHTKELLRKVKDSLQKILNWDLDFRELWFFRVKSTLFYFMELLALCFKSSNISFK